MNQEGTVVKPQSNSEHRATLQQFFLSWLRANQQQQQQQQHQQHQQQQHNHYKQQQQRQQKQQQQLDGEQQIGALCRDVECRPLDVVTALPLPTGGGNVTLFHAIYGLLLQSSLQRLRFNGGGVPEACRKEGARNSGVITVDTTPNLRHVVRPTKKRHRKQEPSRNDAAKNFSTQVRKCNNGESASPSSSSLSSGLIVVEAKRPKTAVPSPETSAQNPIVTSVLFESSDSSNETTTAVVASSTASPPNFNWCATCGASFRAAAELVQHLRIAAHRRSPLRNASQPDVTHRTYST